MKKIIYKLVLVAIAFQFAYSSKSMACENGGACPINMIIPQAGFIISDIRTLQELPAISLGVMAYVVPPALKSPDPKVKIEALSKISPSLTNACPITRIISSGATFAIAKNTNNKAVKMFAYNRILNSLKSNIKFPAPPAVHLAQLALTGILNKEIKEQPLSQSEKIFLASLDKTRASLSPTELLKLAEQAKSCATPAEQKKLAQLSVLTSKETSPSLAAYIQTKISELEGKTVDTKTMDSVERSFANLDNLSSYGGVK